MTTQTLDGSDYSTDYSDWSPIALRRELTRLRNEVSFLVSDRGGPPRDDQVAGLNRQISRITKLLEGSK